MLGRLLLLTRRPPSGLKATLTSAAVCPLHVRSSWPVCAFHTFTVLSPEALARSWPFGLKATRRAAPLWPLQVKSSWPVRASHSLAVPVTFTHDELVLLNNALNEVCNGIEIDDEEFQTRLGIDRKNARKVLADLHRLLGDKS